ncbi:hypothetical protein G6F62_003382 [Rhizopus arrhizus]|nr:hypothetical protein G6F62_003382 [Rhizopus arrhizus]
MNPDIWPQLKSEIHNKLVAYEYVDTTDSTLSDFVIGLMRVGKSSEELSAELQTLVGSDYDPNVTQWFYDRKNMLENPEVAKAAEPVEEYNKPIEQHVTSTSLDNDTQMNIVKHDKSASQLASENIHKDTRGALNHHSDRSKNRQYSPVRRYNRSRSRSPEYDGSRKIYRGDRNAQKESRSSKVVSRLGNESNESRPSVFERLGTVNPAPAPAVEDTKNQRCKYWPACKYGEGCPYFHPDTVCPDFPNCQNRANECMFIHPETTNLPNIATRPQSLAKLPYPCKYFPYCSNLVCPYIHPLPQQSFYMQTRPYATGQRVPIPCKNGNDCTRSDCHFLHPKDPNPYANVVCKYDGICARPNCSYKHTKEGAKNKVLINKHENTNMRQFSVPEDQIEERVIVGESADIIKPEETSGNMELDDDVVTDAKS